MKNQNQSYIRQLFCSKPFAIAQIHGNAANPLLNGTALFYHTCTGGILIQLEIFHLPDEQLPQMSGFFGLHMHEMGDCTPPFDRTGSHFHPDNRQHPEHAGDFPPLLSNHGYAWMVFYDDRISPRNVINRSIVIHAHADDFFTQPSGNSGDKIGCGVIKALS